MISANIKNIPLVFKTDETIFSPKAVDTGTLAMLSVIDFSPNDKVLDLGCGYGVVGILASKLIGGENVSMCDISETAVQYSKINAELNQIKNVDIKVSDEYENIEDSDFTLILSNPSPNTPITALCETKAFGSISLIKRKIVVDSRFFASTNIILTPAPV
mgnify:CR=1 FL=1